LLTLRDGRISSGSSDKSIKFWHTHHPGSSSSSRLYLIHTLSNAHTMIINDLVELADNNQLASASNDKSIKIWDLEGYKERYAISNAHNGHVLCLKYLPNGLLASAGDDLTIRLWHLTSSDGYSLVNSLTAHTGQINALESLDYETLLSGSQDQTIRAWNVTTGQLLQTFNPFSEAIYCLKLVSNGLVAVGGKLGSVQYWQIKSNSEAVLSKNETLNGTLDRIISMNVLLTDDAVNTWLLAGGSNKGRIYLLDQSQSQVYTNSVLDLNDSNIEILDLVQQTGRVYQGILTRNLFCKIKNKFTTKVFVDILNFIERSGRAAMSNLSYTNLSSLPTTQSSTELKITIFLIIGLTIAFILVFILVVRCGMQKSYNFGNVNHEKFKYRF
jgi:WD40 repeat protein